jgi:hypothetical protein
VVVNIWKASAGSALHSHSTTDSHHSNDTPNDQTHHIASRPRARPTVPVS